ncbi:MAG: hypothetical protein AAGF92_10125 [Myxococcota bacterium]
MRTLITSLMVLSLASSSFVQTASAEKVEEGYIPASSGKRFTPVLGPELRVITGATVGVPIFLDNDREVVRPGGEMNFWVGLDIGWLVFAGGFGASWTPIDLASVDGGQALGRSPLARLYIQAEVRLQVPVAKAVLPFISGAFDANWWRHRDTQGLTCDFWYCLDRSRFTFAPGFTGKLGLGIKIGTRVYLDVGSKISLTGTGDFFESSEWFVTPFLGITYRGDPD